MRAFTLLEPHDLDEACGALAEHEAARPIAGGTSLVILIKQGFFPADVLVNLMKIQGADRVDIVDGTVRIGALATMSDIEGSALVREHLPALASACHVVANVRVRNVATLGGNLAHADYQADPPTALLALDAIVQLRSLRRVRRVLLEDFLQGVYTTGLESDELLEAILIPVPAETASWTYSKFKTRSSEDRPTAGVAVGLATEGGTCARLRLAIGAATAGPVRIRDAELAADGRPIGPELFEEVAEVASVSIDPIEDLNGDARYKRRVVRALVRRALEDCASQKEQA